ncbi:MAG TPA: universal stress protein [Vicinamibacterales bacterium]
MIEFKQILCPVDFSDFSSRSFAHATALANWYEAQLTVLHVVPTFDPVPITGRLGEPVHVEQPSREQVIEQMRQALDLPADAPNVRLVAADGDPRTAIINQAALDGTDLIVIGTHGRRGFKRLLLGSVAEAVLREAPCPVLTVPPQAEPGASPEVTFKRIICPIDFSPASVEALGVALNLARQADGRVTLLHAIEWLAEEEPRSSAHFNIPEFRRHMVADAQEQLRQLVADESRTWVEISDIIVFGRPHREILRAAEDKPADLIVMGAQGRGGIGLALFGSTTQQVVRGATCPVLTVRGSEQA